MLPGRACGSRLHRSSPSPPCRRCRFSRQPKPRSRQAGGAAAVAARVSACDAPALTLPDSIELEDGLEPTIRWALEHSPTFRQQCRALAASPRLRARVVVSYPPAIGTLRARTSITETGRACSRPTSRSSACSTSPSSSRTSSSTCSSSWMASICARSLTPERHAELADGAFETERAIAAGQQVAGEVVNNAPDRVRSAGASLWRGLRRAVGAQRRSRAQ